MPEMNAQERIVATVEVLAEAGRDGLANKEVMTALKVSAATACRDLDLLKELGWVERTPKGAARLTPRFGALANKIARSFQEARLRLSADEERYRDAMQ